MSVSKLFIVQAKEFGHPGETRATDGFTGQAIRIYTEFFISHRALRGLRDNLCLCQIFWEEKSCKTISLRQRDLEMSVIYIVKRSF